MDYITRHQSLATKKELIHVTEETLPLTGGNLVGPINFKYSTENNWNIGISYFNASDATLAGFGFKGNDTTLEKIFFRFGNDPSAPASGPGIDITSTGITVTGSASFTETINGNLNGNASTASSATYAASASTAGSATTAGYATSAGSASTADTANSAPWSGVTGKPTTLSGYNITDAIPSSQKGAANGVAPLGADSKINKSYIPTTLDSLTVTATITGNISGNSATATTASATPWSGVTGKPTTLGGYNITDAIPSSQKGAASGVAPLDSSSKIDKSYIPTSLDNLTVVNTINGSISGNSSYATTAGTANAVTWANVTGKPTFGSLASLNSVGLANMDATARADGKQTIWIPAGALRSRSTNGPEAISTQLGTNGTIVSGLAFDPATVEFAQIQIRMPKGWNEGTITYTPVWTANSTSTLAVVWGMRTKAIANDVTIDSAWGGGVLVTDNNTATAYQAHIAPESGAVAVSAVSELSLVVFEIYRDAANAADTLAADAILMGFTINYTADSANDA